MTKNQANPLENQKTNNTNSQTYFFLLLPCHESNREKFREVIEIYNLNPRRIDQRVLVAEEHMAVIVLNSGREKALKEIEAGKAKLNVPVVVKAGEQTGLGSEV